MDATKKTLLIALLTVIVAANTIERVNSQEGVAEIFFYMDTGLGGPRIINNCSGTVPIGENVTCTVRPAIYFYNDTRIVFKGWYKDGELITNDITIKVMSEGRETFQVYIARYQVEYLVELDVGYTTITEWKPRHSTFAFKVEEPWNPRKGMRKLFLKWVGDMEGSDPSIYIEKITKPFKMKAVWATQYYVEIISEYPLSVESGWFNETQTIIVEPTVPVIYENSGETKIVLENYVIDYWIEDQRDLKVFENSFRLTVNSPLTVKASWVKLHHVVLESDHVGNVLLDEWVRDGDRLTFNQLEKEITWNNGTKIVFERWENGITSSNINIDSVITSPLRAYAVWKVYYLVSADSSDPNISVSVNRLGWIEKGSHVIINATPTERQLGEGVKALFKEWSGSIISSNPLIEISSLDKPVIVKAVWIKKYLVMINALEEAGMEKEIWVEEDGDRKVIAPLQVLIDNFTRAVFENWVGCSSIKDNVCILSNVSQPLTIIANYLMEKKVRIEALSLSSEIIENVSYIIRHESGEVKKLSSSDASWMKIGRWVVENATWNGYEVTSAKEFRVMEGSSEYIRLPVKIFSLSFKISDYLGLPVKDAEVTITTNDGKVIYEGRTDGRGSLDNVGPLPPVDLTAYIAYMDYRISRQINLKTSSPIYITIPYSQTSIQLIVLTIAMSGSLITYATIRKMRKPREIPTEIPVPLEPPPQTTIVEEDVEVKSAPIVTLEEVIKKLEMSGEKPEEVLGELVEGFLEKKEYKGMKKSSSK